MSKSVLSFGAHPDDIEIGCAGTEALLLRERFEIVHAILTSGEAGGQKNVREAEALDAARILGASKVEFLRFADGFTQFTREMKVQVMALIRKVRPEIIFVHSSQDRFPDHRLAHELVMAATTAAAGPWYPEAAGAPHAVKTIYGYEVWNPIPEPQLFVGIAESLEVKMKALAAHRSQMRTVAYHDAFLGLARYRGIMSMKGAYAEAFEVLRTVLERRDED